MEKFVYIVVHTTGTNEDYFEYVVGVTDSEKRASLYAKKVAEIVNQSEHYYFSADQIKCRAYELNQILLERNLPIENIRELGTNPLKEVVLYRSNGWALVPTEQMRKVKEGE